MSTCRRGACAIMSARRCGGAISNSPSTAILGTGRMVSLQDEVEARASELRALHGEPRPRLCRQLPALHNRGRPRRRFPRPLREARTGSQRGARARRRRTARDGPAHQHHAEQGRVARLPELLLTRDAGPGRRVVSTRDRAIGLRVLRLVALPARHGPPEGKDGGPGSCATSNRKQYLATRCGRKSPSSPKKKFSAAPAPDEPPRNCSVAYGWGLRGDA